MAVFCVGLLGFCDDVIFFFEEDGMRIMYKLMLGHPQHEQACRVTFSYSVDYSNQTVG